MLNLAGDPHFEADWHDVLSPLRQTAARILRQSKEATAIKVLLQALTNAAETAKTRSSGLIYEFRSPDPATQAATDELLTAASARTTGHGTFRQVSFTDIAMCLRYLHRQVAEALKRGVNTTTLGVLFDLAAADTVRATAERF